MKNVNGAMAHKSSILKSIVLVMLVFITTITVGCGDNSQKAVADIGGSRAQETRKESASTDDIGGSKTIKGEFTAVTDIGGGKNSNGGLQISEATAKTDIGGKSTNVGKMVFAAVDIGGRNTILTGNISEVLSTDLGVKNKGVVQSSQNSLVYDIGGGRDVVIIKLTLDAAVFDIGGGGKSTSTVLV